MIECLTLGREEAGGGVPSRHPLVALSSAVYGGGFQSARAVVNLHVPRHACADPAAVLEDFARRAAVPEPYVGLLTGAMTELATTGEEESAGIPALAVTTVGLSNRMTAAHQPLQVWRPGTMNAIVIVDGNPDPPALVNAVMTVTEVKTLALHEAGVRDGAGRLATGTSTDAVVVAATGRGPAIRFGGPASELGW